MFVCILSILIIFLRFTWTLSVHSHSNMRSLFITQGLFWTLEIIWTESNDSNLWKPFVNRCRMWRERERERVNNKNQAYNGLLKVSSFLRNSSRLLFIELMNYFDYFPFEWSFLIVSNSNKIEERERERERERQG